jgi:hypothetical protein
VAVSFEDFMSAPQFTDQFPGLNFAARRIFVPAAFQPGFG